MEPLEPIEVQQERCERYRNMLGDLARIHAEIDAPTRTVTADDPEWVLRLRKVCLHAVAITNCEVNADGMHAMTAEMRAAYEQMAAVWKRLPDGFRFVEDESWWSNEARSGLAVYNHPTMMSLGMPLADGGFAYAEDPRSYLQIAVWMGRLGCGYGLALAYLAQVLGAEADVDSRLEAALAHNTTDWEPA